MEYIKVFIIIFIWSVLSRKGHLWPFGQEMIVNEGDNVTLDCKIRYLNGRVRPQHPVFWAKDDCHRPIAIKENTSDYKNAYIPDTTSSWLYSRHSVTYSCDSKGCSFSLSISDVQHNDSGEYKCIDSHDTCNSTQPYHTLYKIYVHVSTVRCLCEAPERLAQMASDDRVDVSCPLEGYQPSLDRITTVNITLGYTTIQGYCPR